MRYAKRSHLRKKKKKRKKESSNRSCLYTREKLERNRGYILLQGYRCQKLSDRAKQSSCPISRYGFGARSLPSGLPLSR